MKIYCLFWLAFWTCHCTLSDFHDWGLQHRSILNNTNYHSFRVGLLIIVTNRFFFISSKCLKRHCSTSGESGLFLRQSPYHPETTFCFFFSCLKNILGTKRLCHLFWKGQSQKECQSIRKANQWSPISKLPVYLVI